VNCRHCANALDLTLIDLGSAPLSNAYLTASTLHAPEQWLPLRVLVCRHCWLVQTEDFARPDDLFHADYAYFSSFSDTWLEHARLYASAMTRRLGLGAGSRVVEIAANDGYLLQYFRTAGIPCLGVEPTAATAQAARARELTIIEDFFGQRLAEDMKKDGWTADLLIANNVLAHVPDINDFVSGFSLLLKPDGVATFEFPHLLNLLRECQFDTIYHEHYSYLSLTAVSAVFHSNGLGVFDVERLTTHGGSLRVYAQRKDTGRHPTTDRVSALLMEEKAAGVDTPRLYSGFQGEAEKIKNGLLRFLLDCHDQGLTVAGYGAAAKGNTLLNFAGVRSDLLPYVVDRNPAKQGKYLPGSRIPIVAEAHLMISRPDMVLILPWNLENELAEQLSYIKKWNAKLVRAIPKLEILT